MGKANFVYVTYIQTTPEKIWQAITQPDITRRFWGHENISDWKPGSDWKHVEPGNPPTVRMVGKVVESTPAKKLVFWWVDPKDVSKPDQYSRVTIDLEPLGDMVRLTVTHDELEAGSDMEKGITEGWPRVLSSMKSLLETGHALETWRLKKKAA